MTLSFKAVMKVLLVVIGLEIGILAFLQYAPQNEKTPFQTYAAQIVQSCSSESYRPVCYDREIPKLMDVLSMEEAFEVTKLVQQQDGQYWYCHVLGHNISAREVAKDPSAWKEVVARCPSGMCSNGCIHGAFQERFRVESLPDAKIEELKPELEGVCKKKPGWNPTGMEQATCSHALGHLAMYITDADINKATTLCEELAGNVDGRNFSQICFDGAFMQIFQPLEPEDLALVKGKQPSKESFHSFCNEFRGARKSSCISEGWPLFSKEIVTPQGLVQFCSFLQDDLMQERRCYGALFYVLTAQFNFDENRLKSFCQDLPQERKGQCFANAASRMIETDTHLMENSIRMCSIASTFGVGERCYEELLVYSTYNFHPGSEEFFRLCSSLPELWKSKCLARGGLLR